MKADTERKAEEGLTWLGRLGLAGRTGFYAILTGLTIRLAVMGGRSGHQADAQGALALVSGQWIGKAAIAAVALGFVLFGVGRVAGTIEDKETSTPRRAMTVIQGVFYLALAYVPCSYLAGNTQTGSQQSQDRTTEDLLNLPAGRVLVIGLGAVLLVVCGQQIRGALQRDYRDGLDLAQAPGLVRRIADVAGVIGITARALVFLPIGIFFIVSGVRYDAGDAKGTDGELLALSGHTWGVAVLALVAAGLAVFVVYSGIEARYRKVVSAT